MRAAEAALEAFVNIGQGEVDVRNIGEFRLVEELRPGTFHAHQAAPRCAPHTPRRACPSVYACTLQR